VDLRGKTALVTGGGTGLGRAIALALAEAGASVAVNYAHSADEAAATVEDITRLGSRACAFKADVSNWDEVGEMVRGVQAQLGAIQILVNNAGVSRYVPTPELSVITERDWETILGTNVVGAFACVRAVVPGMLAIGSGRILNTASNSAFTSAGSSIPYVVSKAALVSLTLTLARTLAPTILVNAIAPGWMETRWLNRYLPADVQRTVAESRFALIDVSDAASGALALITNDAITGEVLVIDRGERLGS
jgi:3-oxoacyl-[acyl-carrier protein] reductase